jgi:hypothetical protein
MTLVQTCPFLSPSISLTSSRAENIIAGVVLETFALMCQNYVILQAELKNKITQPHRHVLLDTTRVAPSLDLEVTIISPVFTMAVSHLRG